MKVIEIEKLEKIYDESEFKVHAVRGIDLSFEQGEFAAIVGPSGSGKTTLLNMLGGLDNPTTGKITIGGIDISSLKSSELINFRLSNIGFVFQAYNLIPVLTAKENVEFIMHLQGRPKAERDARTRELLEAVGLGDRLNSRPSKLSGGQQQRVAFARAIVTRPTLLLADEPTGNLDSKNGTAIMDLLTEHNRTGATVVMVTHSQKDASYAHRIIHLHDGAILN